MKNDDMKEELRRIIEEERERRRGREGENGTE